MSLASRQNYINIVQEDTKRKGKETTMTLRILLVYTLFSVNCFCIVSAKYCSSFAVTNQCDYDEVCCNNQCVYGSDCSGRYCYFDSDCSTNQECCDNSCSYSCDTVGVILGAVFGVLFIIFLISFIVCCCVRRRQGLYVRPVVGQRIITSTTTTTRNYRPVPNYPQQGLYQGQPPYGYQQGYAQPPPQYTGYGATNPTTGPYQPWQSGSTGSCAQPPPYEEVPAKVTTAGANANQKSNHSEPSAPPM